MDNRPIKEALWVLGYEELGIYTPEPPNSSFSDVKCYVHAFADTPWRSISDTTIEEALNLCDRCLNTHFSHFYVMENNLVRIKKTCPNRTIVVFRKGKKTVISTDPIDVLITKLIKDGK